MAALTLLIIRHAEKPGEDWPGPGLTLDGTPDANSLVIRGWQRAGAWAALFGAGFGAAAYPAPTAVYAADPNAPAGEGVSKRPYETAVPLADRLFGTTPNTTYAQGNEKALVQALLGLSGVVLVAWEHKAIVESLVPLIPISSGTPPTHWNGSRYDVVLRFDRPDGATGFAFTELFPMLLSGDSDKPLH
ncbi:MAG: histidine phosphatase family protein [Reyranellales bacterium]